MGWVTTECPLPQVEIQYCDSPRCRALARIHFLSQRTVVDEIDSRITTIERRTAIRCDAHADELRVKVEKRAVAVTAAPKPVQQAIDPVEQLLEPKLAEKPKRPPMRWPLPDTTPTTCTTCGDAIHWIVTAAEKRMPINAFGELAGASHFANCPQAAQHRRPRTTTASR